MVHLHTHTMYSLLDATIKPEELAEKLLKIGQDTIAITDHGNLYGAVEFYHKLSDKGIKVITGCEVYICDDVNEKNKDSKYYHLVLLCKNEQGRLNLNKLVSKSTKYKYFGKPRVDFKMLEEYHEGLICLSACMAGELSRAIENNDTELAIYMASKYKNLFGEDYYIEYQAHENEKQQKINSQLIMIANKLTIPFVVTCDAHYLNKEDKEYHSIFIQINQKREANEIYDDCYVQTEDEVREKCWLTTQYNEQAIRNTQVIADKCQNTIPLSPPIIPHVDIPKEYQSEAEYLKKLCNKGFKEKGFSTWEYDDWLKYLTVEYTDKNGEEHSYLPFEFHSAKEVKKKYIDRARYEMNALIKMGFEGYYLLVHSYVNVAKRRGIARGSGGGSLLAYLIGIVDIDPIKYGLYFERFIDVGALDLLADGMITKKELKIPDFDVDFSPTDRDKVMQSIIERYHSENVVCLGQFSYIWAKGAIKDIGKVLGIPFETTNTMTKKLNDETIEKALESGVLDEYKEQYPKLFKYASKLSGLPKSFGVHPCGKCICTREADYYNALEYSDTANSWVLQGDMHTSDDLGLVKIDLLGLRTLDVIYDVLEMIGKDYNYIAPHKINTNDKKVWSEFEKGHTDCIFQFESAGMKKMLHDMKCNTIENLSAANALYRPGSIEYIPNYVNRKNGVEKIEYLHEELEPILKNSYGIIVFQEQLIEIGRLAGLRNPDELRKATAKKKPELMAKIEPELKNGLIKRGWSIEQVDTLWNDILKFAKYSFNKSHSSAYALTAYISMFLKVHHSAEFFTACINSYNGELSEVAKTINEAKRMGVKVIFDPIEIITARTICYDNTVHLGIDTIKGCGEHIAKSLNEMSQCTDFHQVLSSYKDLHISLPQLKILIQLGFFAKYGKSQTLLDMCNIYEKYNKSQYFKDKVDFPENIIKDYFKETAKKYIVKDKVEFLKTMCQNIEIKNVSISQKMKIQNEFLGYIDYINPKAKKYGFVLDVDTRYSPKVKIYRLNTGEIITCKVSKKNYQENPISADGIIIFLTERRNKSKLVNGKWVKILDKFEDWITNYTFYK